MNAAKALEFMLQTWTVPAGDTPEVARGTSELPPDIEFWRSQAEIVNLVQLIERDLDQLAALGDGISSYRRHVASWYSAAFSYANPWQSTDDSPRKALSESASDMLEALGDHIDSVGLASEMDDERTPTLLDLLEEAEVLAREDPELPQAFRRYLVALLEAIRDMLLRGTPMTPEEMERVSTELTGAMTRAAAYNFGTGSDDRRNKWMAFAFSVMSFLNQPLPAAITAGVTLKLTGAQ